MPEADTDRPPPAIPSSRIDPSLARPTLAMVLRRVAFWIGICSISAAPSMAITLTDLEDFPLAALLLGILTFAIVAGTMTSLPWVRGFTRHARLRRSILIAYVARTIFAALPVASVFVDMFVGMIAIGTGSLIRAPFGLGNEAPSELLVFVNTYFLVLWQGVLLNALVWLLVLSTWLFQRIFLQPPSVRSPESCPFCTYDLRGTLPGQPCPECGETRLAQCVDCGRNLAAEEPTDCCPSCGSTRGILDPRSRSWIDRVSPLALTSFVLGCIVLATILSFINLRFI